MWSSFLSKYRNTESSKRTFGLWCISKLSGDTVKFGAKVTLVDEDSEDEASYQIVGEFEADVKKGKISISSPIARAIIGKKKGDSVEVNTPGGGKSYEILKVKWA